MTGVNRMSLTQLRYFCKVAETGSVTETAQLFGVTPPAVSASVGKLAKLVGRELFYHASGGRLALTQEGNRAYAHALQMLQSASSLLGQHPYRKHMRAGLMTHLGPEWATHILSPRRSWNHAHWDLVEGDIQELLRNLMNGYLDVALMYDHGIPDSLSRAAVATNIPYVVVPASIAPDDGLFSLSRVRDLPLITVKPESVSEMYRQVCEHVGVQPIPGPKVASVATACSLIAQGYGFTLLHQRQSLPYGVKALEIQEDISAFACDLALFYRADHLPTSMRFIDELVDAMRHRTATERVHE